MVFSIILPRAYLEFNIRTQAPILYVAVSTVKHSFLNVKEIHAGGDYWFGREWKWMLRRHFRRARGADPNELIGKFRALVDVLAYLYGEAR
jgi:hypothetical protein